MRYVDWRSWKPWATIIGVVYAIALLANCAALKIQKPPSICEEFAPGESVLCDIALKYDLHLETVGNIILVADLRAIKQKAYTKRKALEVFDKFELALQEDITANRITQLAISYAYNYPELLLVMPYLNYLKVDTPITEKDKEMLIAWIDQNRTMLNQ